LLSCAAFSAVNRMRFTNALADVRHGKIENSHSARGELR
jgi:hypothetical protein